MEPLTWLFLTTSRELSEDEPYVATEKAEAWKRPIVFQLMPETKLRYLQGLWPHLVPGYFFTIFSVSKLSLPGTLILTHVSISSDPFW